MMDPKITTLITLCETGSFSETAKRLSLTQPAVSKHIKFLEEEWRVPLAKKRGKSVVLTREGEIVLRYSRLIREMYERAREDICAAGASQDGHVRIGLSDKLTKRFGACAAKSEAVLPKTDDRDEKHIGTVTVMSSTERLLEAFFDEKLDAVVASGSELPSAGKRGNEYDEILIDRCEPFVFVSEENPVGGRNVADAATLGKMKLAVLLSGDEELSPVKIREAYRLPERCRVAVMTSDPEMGRILMKGGFGVLSFDKNAFADESEKPAPVPVRITGDFDRICALVRKKDLSFMFDVLSAIYI